MRDGSQLYATEKSSPLLRWQLDQATLEDAQLPIPRRREGGLRPYDGRSSVLASSISATDRLAWSPEMNGAPAKARFKFNDEAARDRFVAGALAIERISLWTPAS